MSPHYAPKETADQKEIREAEEEDAYFCYECPICEFWCDNWFNCGCGQEVNLPKD